MGALERRAQALGGAAQIARQSAQLHPILERSEAPKRDHVESRRHSREGAAKAAASIRSRKRFEHPGEKIDVHIAAGGQINRGEPARARKRIASHAIHPMKISRSVPARGRQMAAALAGGRQRERIGSPGDQRVKPARLFAMQKSALKRGAPHARGGGVQIRALPKILANARQMRSLSIAVAMKIGLSAGNPARNAKPVKAAPPAAKRSRRGRARSSAGQSRPKARFSRACRSGHAAMVSQRTRREAMRAKKQGGLISPRV